MSDIEFKHHTKGIAIITLDDELHKNYLSYKVITSFINIFKSIRDDKNIKVVVILGNQNYFSCGADPEILALTNVLSKYSSKNLYFIHSMVDCEIPIIAGMQGHAIGAGLSLGLWADITIMAEESLYSALFMNYGFTPDTGSTYIVPEKLGMTLGSEMLFTAKYYQGSELKERGAPVKIVKKKDVLSCALSLASELEEKPYLALTLLKKQLANRINLNRIMSEEEKMHGITFKLEEVQEKIKKQYKP